MTKSMMAAVIKKWGSAESFAFDDVARAHEKLEGGHVRGKLVLRVSGELS